jgi:hypothetical protein
VKEKEERAGEEENQEEEEGGEEKGGEKKKKNEMTAGRTRWVGRSSVVMVDEAGTKVQDDGARRATAVVVER